MIHKNEDGTYPAYAWPGGYPLYFITADGALCPSCANLERERIESTDPEYSDDDQWRIAAQVVNWKDPDLYCDHCGERIESAYAEED